MADKVAVAQKWIRCGYKVTLVVRIVGISRSCYYYHTRYRRERVNFGGRPIPGYSKDRKGRRVSDEQIKEWLCEAIEGDCYNYGYVKLTAWLKREYGLIINRKKIYRLCKELEMLKPQRKVRRRYPRRLAKKRDVTAPNQLWEIDIKYGYVAGEDRFFFIMSILDVFDRMVVDYHTGLSCTGRDAAHVLSRARDGRSPEGEIVVRTDNGPQFISMAFETACEKLSMMHERIPNSSPNSIAHIESFHSILEEDCLQVYEFESFAEAYQVVGEFMHYYNEVRLHSSIGYRPPLEYHNDIMSNSVKALCMSA